MQSLEYSARVWLRAFWGFAPEDEGYLGFTKPGNQRRFITEYRKGDLILIYGADQQQTAPDQRRQVLGFLSVDPIPIKDTDKQSKASRECKLESGWQDRWTHAVPARHAWRITRKIEAHHIAAKSFSTYNPVLIASRGELLLPEEVVNVLKLPVVPANVYGETILSADLLSNEAQMQAFFHPSKGFNPSFGVRTYTVEDEENRLYVLKLNGNVGAFLGRQPYEVKGKSIIKIGHAKEPQNRCDTHNTHLPPACAFKWSLRHVSKPFPGGREAKHAEDSLKSAFATQFESLGGEFYLVDDTKLAIEFAKNSKDTAFQIKI